MPRSQPALPPFAASAKYQPSRIYELRTEWTFDHGAQLPLATLNFGSDMDQQGSNRQDNGVPQLLDLFTNRPYVSFVAYERVSLIRQAIR